MPEPMKAYVLVQTDGRTDRIAGLVRTVPGVLFAEDVRGPYDALAMTRRGVNDGELEATLAAIRELPGVIRALPAPLVGAPAEVATSDAA